MVILMAETKKVKKMVVKAEEKPKKIVEKVVKENTVKKVIKKLR